MSFDAVDYIRNLKAQPLAADADDDLYARMGSDDPAVAAKARNEHAIGLSRLVVNVANGYRNSGIGLDDLIEAGMHGLAVATNTWRADKGRPTTWAVHCVRSKIHGLIKEHRSRRGLGRAAAPAIFSLDHQTGGDDGAELADLIADDRTADPADAVADRDEAAAVRAAVADLPERWRYVVRCRTAGMTLRDIALELHVTHQRVRQIEEKAHQRIAARLSGRWTSPLAALEEEERMTDPAPTYPGEEIVADYEFRRPNGTYPWGRWSDGTARRLKQGVAFNCKPATLITAARKQASRMKQTVRAVVETDGSVVLQFVAAPPAVGKKGAGR